MHPAPTPDLLTVFAGFWFFAMLACALLIGVFWPIMALIVTLNIRGIRRELRQLNETLSLPSRRF